MSRGKTISRSQIEREKGKNEYEIESNPSLRYVPVDQQDPKAVALALKAIEKEKRVLRAQDVVEVARDKDSPLHPYFDWSEGDAAQKWREHQARSLIASVRVVLSEAPNRPPLRAFLHVPTKSHYSEAAKVMTNPEKRRLVLNRALNELESFQRRYAEMEELAAIFRAVERTAPKLREELERHAPM